MTKTDAELNALLLAAKSMTGPQRITTGLTIVAGRLIQRGSTMEVGQVVDVITKVMEAHRVASVIDFLESTMLKGCNSAQGVDDAVKALGPSGISLLVAYTAMCDALDRKANIAHNLLEMAAQSEKLS